MVLGAFVAVAPRVHRAALLGAIPVELRPRVEAFLTRTRQGLRRWMASVLLSMGIMGLVVTGGLWLLGVPYFLVFGILAGVMELIPYVGPFAAFIGPITVCLATDPTRAVWVMVFYAVVHGLEANVLVPLLMKGRAHLPPSLVILAILFFGCIAGVLGRIAAAPALIVTLAAVEQFWLAPADLVAADGSPRAGTTETRAAA
jgi:predicted PurR-regulated permease PerM